MKPSRPFFSDEVKRQILSLPYLTIQQAIHWGRINKKYLYQMIKTHKQGKLKSFPLLETSFYKNRHLLDPVGFIDFWEKIYTGDIDIGFIGKE